MKVPMNQSTFDFEPLPKKTCKEMFLEKMVCVVPWSELVALIQPHALTPRQALGGRPPFAVETMLRFRHLLEKQQLAPRIFETINTVLAHHGLLLRTGAIVDASIIAAPSSTKNSKGEPDPRCTRPGRVSSGTLTWMRAIKESVDKRQKRLGSTTR